MISCSNNNEETDQNIADFVISANVNAGETTITGQISSTDPDAGSTLQFEITGDTGAPDGFTLNSDGSFSFDPADSSYFHLDEGDTEEITILVTVTDDQGATETTAINITVTGTNDAPVAIAAVTTSVDEGDATIFGQLTFIDADDDATVVFSISGDVMPPAGFALESNGQYSFDPADTAYDHLNVGDTEMLTIPVTLTDDLGALDTTEIQITVMGTNDSPVASVNVTRSVDEGATTITGQLTFTDVDDGSTAVFSFSSGSSAPAGFGFNGDGSYSFNPSDINYDHLNVGDSDVLIIPVTVTDDQGATDTTQIQITVIGTNDNPDAGVDVILSVDEGSAIITGQLIGTDFDDAATATFVITGGVNAPAGFTLNTDGSYSFDPAVVEYEHLNTGDSELLTIAVTMTDDQGASDSMQILITVTGANNIPDVADDTYSTFGNTVLEVGVLPGGSIATKISGSVLDNDVDLDVSDILTVEIETSPVSGSVTINAQGNFTYVPAAGETSVSDSFSYRAFDGTDSAVATVTINITKRIWYVDNRNSGGTGVSNDPFDTLVDTELVAEDEDYIYIAYGDGTSTGLDSGLTLAVPNVAVIGEGEALIINSTTLAAAGVAPSITNFTGSGITLNAADNSLIMGLEIYGTLLDGLVINDSTGIVIDGISFKQIGESAIQGAGNDVELSLTDVIIENVDQDDSKVSDDAIFIAATSSISLVMNGGSISGVPGNLGDGIEFENVNSANTVTMNLDIRGVNFSDIQQDGIKLDNDNGNFNVQIGGSTNIEGNIFDVGFRGVHIKTSADPTLNRTNTISIQNNNITSGNEGIQIRSIEDATHLNILDNTLTRAVIANDSDLIDVQTELMSDTQAHINNNDISNVNGSDGIRLRIFDGATLTIEASNNMIDGPIEGFDFDVIETDSIAIDPTTLNASVLNNTLSNIVSQALNTRNANVTSNTCLDVLGNTDDINRDYVLDAITGSFLLTAASQLIVLDPSIGSIVSGTDTCPVPTF